MTRRAVPIAVVILVALFGASGRAAADCSVAVNLNVVFGAYDVFNTSPLDTTGTVAFRCQAEKNIYIFLSAGSSGTFATRTLRSGTEVLRYNLYRDAARTEIWGDGSGGSSSYYNVNPPNNRWTYVTAYGRIPAGQDATAGTYADTIVVTLQF